MPTKVSSDVARLKKVLLHRPGRELLNLMPNYLNIQLFDDIPWYEKAIEEHDFFADILRSRGVEVRYLRDMLCECVAGDGAREELTEGFISEVFADKKDAGARVGLVREYFKGLSASELIDVMIGGLRKDEAGYPCKGGDYPFLLDPMPNALFTRDPFSFIGSGVAVSRMFMSARQRENLLGDFLLNNHKEFAGVKRYYQRNFPHSIEGGDIMVLTPDALAVGVSERTSLESVRTLAKNGEFKKVLAVLIPNERRFMHLDTIITMVDKQRFVAYVEALNASTAVIFEVNGNDVAERESKLSIKDALKEVMEVDRIDFISCGGGNNVDSAREQWSDGANVLAIAPGEIIVYNRNPVTNRLLVNSGLTVHETPCSELSRGRGGPHCMSMPFLRD